MIMTGMTDEMSETLDEQMEDLVSAEDFLEFFNIDYDASIVHVNRLHILQRFHDYIGQGENLMPESDQARAEVYKNLLVRAYEDFVSSDALTEKVFKVFHMHEPQQTFVSLDDVFK